MNEFVERGPARQSLAETGFVWFQRLAACFCLLFGVLYWVRMVGFYDGSLWRFDLMPMHWQVAAATLAVFFPFAGIGLWMLASWGPVIWGICAVTETVMYFIFPHLYGYRVLIVGCHVVVALLFIAFKVLIHLQSRKTEQYG